MLKGAKALAKAAKLAEENGHEGLLDPTIKIKVRMIFSLRPLHYATLI